jgi:hypothetical protein
MKQVLFSSLPLLLAPAMADAAPDAAAQSTAATPVPAATKPKAAPKPAELIPGGRRGPAGVPQNMRWADDWGQKPKAQAPFLDRIKHISLTDRDDIYLSLGGGLRVYYTDWSHSTLGQKANDANAPVQSRARLYADLHATPYLRAYVELGDNREYGEKLVTGPNNDRFDVQQAFVDLTLPLGEAGQITLRPGRYEMPLGNGKLVGIREGLNMRFSYQGLQASYILPGKLAVQAFSVRPVNIKTGSFDDGPNHNASFMGVYASAPSALNAITAGLSADLYFYEMNKTSTTTREGTGIDHRQNWGARLWKKGKHVDLDLETDIQRGHYRGEPIHAYAVMFEGGYTLAQQPWSPRLGLRANMFSGDGNLTDGRAETFVAAAPRLPLTSEAAFFNLSNLVDIYPSLTVKPRKDVSIMAGPDFLRRQTSADGVYIGPAGASLKPYAGSLTIGTSYNLEASWQATRRLTFKLYETYLAASESLKADGGRNGNYFGLLADWKL